MRRLTVRLPDDFADDVERAAREHGISLQQYLALAVAYRLGREDYRDEIAAIHQRLNSFDERLRRKR